MSKPSHSEFMAEVAQIIRGRFPLVKVEEGAGDFSVRINGQWLPLENLYRMYDGDRQQLVKQVERWTVEVLRAAEGTPDQTGTFEELKERILPIVLSSGMRSSTVPMVKQQLVEGLVVGYAVDSKQTISYITQKLFDEWNMTLDDLHEAALENLVARSETLQAHAAQDESTGQVNLILIQTLDGYDATRILLPGLHDRLREHLGSPFLVGIPNRDILVCFRDEPQTLARLTQQIGHDYASMPHQVTDKVFLMTSDGIALYGGETV